MGVICLMTAYNTPIRVLFLQAAKCFFDWIFLLLIEVGRSFFLKNQKQIIIIFLVQLSGEKILRQPKNKFSSAKISFSKLQI